MGKNKIDFSVISSFCMNDIVNDDGIGIKTNTDTESLKKLLSSLGIQLSSENEDLYKLILWNDEINSMEYVMESLYIICELDEKESFKIMMEAHIAGRAIAKSGSYDEILIMKNALNKKNIEATIEK